MATTVLVFVCFVLPIAALGVWAFYLLIRKAVAHGILDAVRAQATG